MLFRADRLSLPVSRAELPGCTSSLITTSSTANGTSGEIRRRNAVQGAGLAPSSPNRSSSIILSPTTTSHAHSSTSPDRFIALRHRYHIQQDTASKPAPTSYLPALEWWDKSTDTEQSSAGTISGKPAPPIKDQIPLFPASPDLPPGPPPASTSSDKNQDASSSTKPEHAYDANLKDPGQYPRIHTRPVTGRTVFVIPSRIGNNTAQTVSSAFRTISRLVRDMGLRAKSREQKKHMRPGLKRKMLRSKRWRARFKEAFKAATSRALELKKQGW
ncbi:hypothetical protein GQ602_006289 [Ophiocordyceps camponoti-floridani]|uniref:Ribosomal protein S21 n=1 Tax=Ophiocordyceps camponoti-floridani TaxID=2030778 RepID=A0A8H4Q2Y8_9HYPO|nr:hypothetical protein GQ602_006289 [Ophiocordyceps camponoti-floridani]